MDAKVSSPRLLDFDVITSSSLKNRFLRSHLSIALIGIFALLIAAVTIGFLGNNARELAEEQGPTAQASLKVLNGVQTSLAAMRGWVALGEPQFRQQRKQAWSKLIYPNLEELKQHLVNQHEHSEIYLLHNVTNILADLNEAQWWIEDVAHTPGNEPARELYTENGVPLKQDIVQALNSMIDIESIENINDQNHLLLNSLYKIRFHFFKTFSLLETFLDEAEPHNILVFENSLQLINNHLFQIRQEKLNTDMQELVAFARREMLVYEQLSQKMIALRNQAEWNVAQHLLKTDAVPLAESVIQTLGGISGRHINAMHVQAARVGTISQTAIIISIFLLCIIGVVAIILSRRNSRQLIKPINSLLEATQMLAAGKLNKNISMKSGFDELDDLMISFDQMHTELDINRKELEEINLSLEEKVKERTADLQQSNAELEQFAYVASHDLQEPLRMVASYTQLLKRRYEGKLDEEADEFIGYAVDGAKRMQTLIQDLLEFSRLGTKKSSLQETDSNGIYEIAIKNLGMAIEDKGARVETNGLPMVMADEGQLMQLFQNLIANAIKFQRPEVFPTVEVNAELVDEEWQFSVKDNGIGISADSTQRIFQIFKRLHGRNEYEGTGIGLSVCKKIVENHGGRIWIESTEGVGTTFFFTLVQASSLAEAH